MMDIPYLVLIAFVAIFVGYVAFKRWREGSKWQATAALVIGGVFLSILTFLE